MKKILVLLIMISGQIVFGQNHCSATINTPLGSTINEWDWRTDYYTVYRTGKGKSNPKI